MFIFFITLLTFQKNSIAQITVREKPSFKYFFHLKTGTMRESSKIDDPQMQLSRNSIPRLLFGSAIGYHYNNKTRFILDYELLSIGTSPTFTNSEVSSSISGGDNYHKIGLLYERDFFPVTYRSRFNLYFNIGPSLAIASFPNRYGNSSFGRIGLNNNDTLYSVFDTSRINRPVFLSIGGSLGLRYNLNKRFFLSAFVSRSFNLTSNDVTLNQVGYKALGIPGRYYANMRSTGNITAGGITLGYNFGKNVDKEEAKRMQAKNVQWPEKRFAILLLGSNNYPTLCITDPAGYLSRSRGNETTLGLLFRYLIKNKWYISTGFETFPNAVKARPTGFIGDRSKVTAAAIQFPVNVEYNVYSLRKKIKLDVFLKAGLVFGFQPFPSNLAPPTNQVESTIETEPFYYEEREIRTLGKKSYFAFAPSVMLNLHLTKDIFLLAYATRQFSLSNRPFVQSDVQYKMSATQPDFYKASIHTTGGAVQVGFGIGCRF